MTAKKKDSAMFIRKVPDDIRQRFKIWCTLNGVTMADRLIQLMDESTRDIKDAISKSGRTVGNTDKDHR